VSTTDEQKAIFYILRTLRHWGDTWLRHEAPTATQAVKIAKAKFDAVDEAQLSTLLMHSGPKGSFDQTKVIYMRPPPKEDAAVAAIWCRWDYDSTLGVPSCGYYFGLWSPQASFPRAHAPSQDRHIAFVGYRFETPERGKNHNYFHAQPCRSMGRKDDEIESALPISNRMPTWPVAARSGVELLLCLVTAVYGMQGMQDLKIAIGEDVAARKNSALSQAIKNILSLAHDVA
jgi:hypothetical protein